MFSPLIKQLIESLCALPGVGPKSAQRMALHLLDRNRQGGKELAEILHKSMLNVGRCKTCRIFSEMAECNICTNKGRDKKTLCIVGSPSDVFAIEQSQVYLGCYFVLSGHLSPLDGIGPEDIGVEELEMLLNQGIITEVVMATSPTIEGEATSYYLSEIIKDKGIKVSRIAYGVPIGGELEYVDIGTLAKALSDRSEL